MVTALVTGPSALAGVPHIAGVQLDTGETLLADLVVDASGRRTSVPRLLADMGAREPEESGVEAGFTYNTRFYRGEHPRVPRRHADAARLDLHADPPGRP